MTSLLQQLTAPIQQRSGVGNRGTVEARRTGDRHRELIFGAIRQEPQSRRQLMSILALSDVSIDKHCRMLEQQGLIRRHFINQRHFVWEAA